VGVQASSSKQVVAGVRAVMLNSDGVVNQAGRHSLQPKARCSVNRVGAENTGRRWGQAETEPVAPAAASGTTVAEGCAW